MLITGKTLFAQLMDFLPWTTFTRIVDRYAAITGSGRFPAPSNTGPWSQLTYRESLRDIETCLSVHASKLYHMGFRQPVRRSTLACQRKARLAYMRRWPSGSSPRRGRCTSTKNWGWTSAR